MKLWAVADLHLRYEENRRALEALEAPGEGEDWLVVAGDVGETAAELAFAWRILTRRFARVVWVPGNHELWTTPADRGGDREKAARGEAKYRRLVETCRRWGVVTPEDPFPLWPGPRPAGAPPVRIAPLFGLYDYSFRPDDVAEEDAVAWAMEAEILCSDEVLLHPDPHPTRRAWCAARCRISERRLEEATASGERLVLVNHWPLLRELAVLPAVPRFVIWCGTRRTEDWPRRFGAEAVIYGHLHIPGTTWIDGVRFEEVSFGYPRNWRGRRTLRESLRQILPAPEEEIREG